MDKEEKILLSRCRKKTKVEVEGAWEVYYPSIGPLFRNERAVGGVPESICIPRVLGTKDEVVQLVRLLELPLMGPYGVFLRPLKVQVRGVVAREAIKAIGDKDKKE